MWEKRDPSASNTRAIAEEREVYSSDLYSTMQEAEAQLNRSVEKPIRRRRTRKTGKQDKSQIFFQVGLMAYERPELTGVERAVLVGICSFADNEDGTCWPGIRAIAARAGFSAPTVQRSIETLERLGIVRVHRELGRSNYYTLIDHRRPKRE